MDSEYGVPGHAGSSEWARKLQSFLKNSRLSFEAEGDTTRIHLGELQLEVSRREDSSGYQVILMVPLPGELSLEETSISGDAFRRAMSILGRLEGEIYYNLDDSLPGYPVLHIVVVHQDPNRLVELLVDALANTHYARN